MLRIQLRHESLLQRLRRDAGGIVGHCWERRGEEPGMGKGRSRTAEEAGGSSADEGLTGEHRGRESTATSGTGICDRKCIYW